MQVWGGGPKEQQDELSQFWVKTSANSQDRKHVYACHPNVWSVSLDIVNHVCKQAEKIQAVCVYLLRDNFCSRRFLSFFLLVTGKYFSDSEVVFVYLLSH